MANKLEVRIKLPTDAELNKMFDGVAVLDRFQVGDKVIKAAVEPIVKRARELAPRDRAGHGKKRSKSQKNGTTKSGDPINWDYPLWKTIKRVVRKYQKGTLGVVGPEWPLGNKAYFNTSPRGNKGHLWGYAGKSYPKASGGTHVAGAAKARAQIRNWIVDAFEQTKSQQLSIMKTKLKSLMDQVWRG